MIHIISYEYADSLGRETRMEFDLMNREIRRTEADGGVTRRFYDKNGQLVKVIRPSEYEQRGGEHFGRWHGGNWQNDTSGLPNNPDYKEEF